MRTFRCVRLSKTGPCIKQISLNLDIFQTTIKPEILPHYDKLLPWQQRYALLLDLKFQSYAGNSVQFRVFAKLKYFQLNQISKIASRHFPSCVIRNIFAIAYIVAEYLN